MATKQTNQATATKQAAAAPKQTTSKATGAPTTPAESAERSKWANEKARAIAGDPKAANRFAKLASVLLDAYTPGKQAVLSFAEANERAGLQRGARGDAGASWRLAVQRTRQCFDNLPQVSVDAEAQVLRIGTATE